MKLAALFSIALAAAAAGSEALEREMERVSPAAGGVTGAFAVHLESGRSAGLRASDRFPMASTFKVPLAVELLARVDAGSLTLDRMVEIQTADLHPGSGILTQLFKQPGVSLSVRNLLELMMLISDNSATDVLLRLAGGAAAVNARMRTLGVEGIQVDRPTNLLIADFRGGAKAFDADPRDTATPEGMTQLLVRLWSRKALSPASTDLLLDVMRRCQTGEGRIKGMLPQASEVAHKTGSIGGTANDVGIVTLPDGTHVALSVFVKSSDKRDAERDRGIAHVARAVHDYFLFAK